MSWKVLIGAALVLGVLLAGFILVGGVDISADRPDDWLSEHLLHFVFKRTEAARSASLNAPGDLNSEGRIRLAAQHFDMVCANCHGRPGYGQSVVALSMSPRPQYLPNVLGQFTDAELHQIVEHGVKYSAMPAWATDARSDEVWSMVAFLRRLPKLDARSYAEITAPPASSAATPIATGPDATLRAAYLIRKAQPVNEFLYAAPNWGFANETIHTNAVATCARCHGADGSGAVTGGEAPNLTIQDAAYLQTSLEAYTRGGRASGFMQTIAAELSRDQIAALATYYAGLPSPTSSPTTVDPALVRRGEALALRGVPETATPACANCHESTGAKLSGAPHIAGQSPIYLRRQLMVLAQGGRGSSHWWNPMPAVAHSLDAKDIAAVAAYYSRLGPAKASGSGQALQAPLPPNARIDLVDARRIFAGQCLKCHVHDGRGDLKGDYPDLTLQSAPYVAQSLYAFRSGVRPGDQMRQITGGLSLDQLASLAAYVGSLAPRPAVTRPDAAAASRGAAIAIHGVPARGVPACLGCHGAEGVAALQLIPRLQGENVLYLRARLDRFSRPDAAALTALNPMPQIASQLTEGERADLAAYFAAATPLQKQGPTPPAAPPRAGR